MIYPVISGWDKRVEVVEGKQSHLICIPRHRLLDTLSPWAWDLKYSRFHWPLSTAVWLLLGQDVWAALGKTDFRH